MNWLVVGGGDRMYELRSMASMCLLELESWSRLVLDALGKY
jgi:hypothetical protein